MIISVLNRVANIVVKGVNTPNQNFLLFLQFSSKSLKAQGPLNLLFCGIRLHRNLSLSDITFTAQEITFLNLCLTRYQTNPCFNDPGKKLFENNVRKGENADHHDFLLFPQCFLSLTEQISILQSCLFVVCTCFHFGPV